jgi:hypothetical protein
MSAVEDQEPVETFHADGADEAFGDGVRFGRLDRCADELDPFAAEDAVEVAGELGVAVSDKEPNRRR